jgi:endonuclease/exonuclease/phosphatase family metal-dependent hydrolase
MKWMIAWLLLAANLAAGSFSVGTYNLELFSDTPIFNLPPKSERARSFIRKSIRALNADIVALQEVGSERILLNLRASLKSEGLDYPYWDYVPGPDPHLHLACLSRYPILSRHHYTNENFLLEGRRHHVARGFGEFEIEIAPGVRCQFIMAHLKSKRITFEADQQGLREDEALLLHEKVSDILKHNPRANLVVLGDLNDGATTKPIRTIIGRGRNRLFDTHPFERNGDSLPNENSRYEPRRISWTHYFGKEETYSRLDYILASPALREHYLPNESCVVTVANWGAGSDHRPVKASFSY